MPSKNIPVNGWPQIKDLDIAAPILAELDKIETWQKSVKQETKSGAYVEFTNALALDASSVIAEITAEQDLHGYDKPWAGGAGKNLVEETLTSCSIESNGTISDNRTDWSMQIAKITAQQQYTIKSDDPNHSVHGFFTNKPTVGSVSYDGQRYITSSYTFTAPIDGYIAFRTTNGYATPQLEKGSQSTSYEPYSNICPITGFSSVTITDVDAEGQTATVTVALGSTVYGGTLDLTSGELTITHANIASYNGETIGEPWISSLDEYTEGGTPTTGAQVVYILATPTTTTLTAAQLEMVKGYNHISANSGNIEVTAYTGNTWN